HSIASHWVSSGLVTSLILAVAESSLSRFFASAFLSVGGAIVAKILPFVVTVICSPRLAFSRYFSRLALRSLIFTVSMVSNLTNCTRQLYNDTRKGITRQCSGPRYVPLTFGSLCSLCQPLPDCFLGRFHFVASMKDF